MSAFFTNIATLLEGEGGLLALAVSAFVSSTLLPGASEVLLLGLLEQGKSDVLALLVVASVANTAGGFLTYWMGHWAQKGVERFRHRPAPSGATVDALRRWGSPLLLLSWLPLVGDGLCLAAGWLGLRWLPSLIFIFVGKACRYWLLIYAFDIFK